MGDLSFQLLGGGCAAICLGLLIFIIVMLASIKVVNEKQQILYIFPTTKEVKNGPFTDIVWPHTNHELRNAIQVTTSQYAILKHERTQELRHVPGPEFVFMGAYETEEGIASKIVLQKQEYIRLIDKNTGEERVVQGATTLVPRPLEEAPDGVETAIVIGAQNAVLVYNKTSGLKSLVTTAGPFVPAPYEEIQREQQARLLEPLDYAVVKNLLTGEARNEVGPKLLQQGPYEEILSTTKKLVLEKDEYIQLLDKKTGNERVLQGPDQVVPEPTEIAEAGVQKAVFLTDQQAAVVIDRTTGQRRLETTNGVFIPGAYERVMEVRSKYLVLSHQAAVTRDPAGTLRMISGALGSTAFFLQPYEELVQMQWSVYGPDSQDCQFYNVEIEFKATFETKVQMLWKILEKAAEQLADAGERLRTLPEDLDRRFDLEDFVEGRIDWLKEDFDGALEVGSAPVEQEIHWQESPGGAVSTLLAALWKPPAPANGVRTEAFKATFETKDVLTMIAMTADPAGDVSQRARSGLIAAVSKHTFSSFMNDFSNITQEAFTAQSTDSFYAARGVRLQSLEMTRYEMVDQETANILQLIIQESTNRINQLQQQESENDVKAAKLVADIDLEKKKTSLITTQAANEKLQASLQGQAAGTELVESAVAFIDGLTDTVTDVADRTALYRLHQLLDARNVDTNNLATGQAQLFLTPSTLNLQLRMANQEL